MIPETSPGCAGAAEIVHISDVEMGIEREFSI